MIGRVVSTKMTKTVAVLVESRKTHKLYKKSSIRTKKYLAHDELGVKTGDIVEILKVRPISKRKHWKVEKIIGQDVVALGTAELKEDAKVAIAEVLPEELEETEGQRDRGTKSEGQTELVEIEKVTESKSQSAKESKEKAEKPVKAKKTAVKKAQKKGETKI